MKVVWVVRTVDKGTHLVHSLDIFLNDVVIALMQHLKTNAVFTMVPFILSDR